MFINTLNQTILNIWPQLVIIIVVLTSIRLVSINNSNKKFVFHEEFMNLLFVIYILLLFTLLTGAENASGSGFNFVPFSEIFRYKFGSKLFIYNVLGNVLLFVPYGYFVSRYTKSKKWLQVLYASTTIELMQLNLGRTFDIDDILLNVLGGIVGYFLYRTFVTFKDHLPKFLQKDFIYDLISFIILVMIVWYMCKLLGLGWIW